MKVLIATFNQSFRPRRLRRFLEIAKLLFQELSLPLLERF
jgi:hypothetical protein